MSVVAANSIRRLSALKKNLSIFSNTFSTDGGDDGSSSKGASKQRRFTELQQRKVDSGSKDDPLSMDQDILGDEFRQTYSPQLQPGPGFYVANTTQNDISRLHVKDPETWTPKALAEKFGLSKARVRSIIALKDLEVKTFGDYVDEDKNEKLFPKEIRPSRYYDYRENSISSVLKKHQIPVVPEPVEAVPPPAVVDPFMDYLHDFADPNVPSTSTRSDPRKKVYGNVENYYKVRAEQTEAISREKSAANDGSQSDYSAFPTEKSPATHKFKIAVKELGRHMPLRIRDETGVLRLATPDEACKRSWVRQPPAIELVHEKYTGPHEMVASKPTGIPGIISMQPHFEADGVDTE